MIRLVLDTNIIVSALLSPTGLPAQILVLTLNSNAQLCVSGAVYREYEEVLHRPRLKRSDKEIASALAAIRQSAFWVVPLNKVTVCSDPDDNIFLECAQTAQAHFLITGNSKHFPTTWGRTKIVTARQFVDQTSGY